MTDIRFRLWIEETGQYIYLPNLQEMKHSTRPPEGGDNTHSFQFNLYTSDRVIWQQFIGFKDCKGVDIFEGDRVKFLIERHEHDTEECTGDIIFDEEFGQFLIQGYGDGESYDLTQLNLLRETIEVIK